MILSPKGCIEFLKKKTMVLETATEVETNETLWEAHLEGSLRDPLLPMRPPHSGHGNVGNIHRKFQNRHGLHVGDVG